MTTQTLLPNNYKKFLISSEFLEILKNDGEQPFPIRKVKNRYLLNLVKLFHKNNISNFYFKPLQGTDESLLITMCSEDAIIGDKYKICKVLKKSGF